MKRKHTKIALVLVLMALLVVAAGCGGNQTVNTDGDNQGSGNTSDKVIKWRMQTFMASGSYVFELNKDYTDKVREVTGGRLDIQLYPAGSLFPDMEVLESVGSGVVEMALNYGGFYQGTVPEATLVQQQPYGILDWMTFHRLSYVDGWKELYDPLLEKHNVGIVARLNSGAEPIRSNKPLRSIKDFEGLKLRATGSTAQFFNQYLKSNITTVPGPELYSALQLKTVDAAEYSSGSMDYDLGLHEVAPYIILPEYMGLGQEELMVNLDAYKALPDDIKAQFNAVNGWYEPYFYSKLAADDEKKTQKMIEEGGQIIWLPEEEQQQLRTWAKEFWVTKAKEISPTAVKMMELYAEAFAKQ